MKKILKLIFGIIGGVLLLVLLVVVGVIIAFTSSKDEFDASKINTSLTKQTLIANTLNNGLDKMKDDYALSVSFTEEDLNSLIYCFVKEDLNEKYNPIDGQSNEELYIKTIALGGTSVDIRHAYAKIDGDIVSLNLTGAAFGFLKTRILIDFKVETTDNDYILKITNAKVGKVKLSSGLVLNIAKKNNLETEANKFFEEKDIPFVLNIEELTLTASKEDFSAWVNKLITKDEEEKDASSVMAETLVDVLLSTENDFVTFGMVKEGSFGVDINLEVLKVSESETTLDPAIKESVDAANLIKNKSQTLAINAIKNNGMYMTITETEISRLIYSFSDGYEKFKKSSELMEGVTFDFAIEGIIFDIGEEGKTVTITIILNINGLLTVAKYSGNTVQVSNTMINIEMDDVVILGKDLDIDSEFIGALLEESFKDNTFLSFDKDTNTFTISSSVFDNYLNEASLVTAVHVNGIDFTTDNLNLRLATLDPALLLTLNKASDLIKNALKGDFLDTSLYSQDEATQQILSELNEELEDIKDKLNDPSFDIATLETDSLVGTINELSTEDQEVFFGQLQAEAGDEDLEKLYGDLFGDKE